MLSYNAERLIRLFESRHKNLGSWRTLWAELAHYIMPSQYSGLIAQLSPGTTIDADVYDSTARIANDRLANRLHEALTNPATEWFHLAFKNAELEDDDAAREWLDDCEDKLRQAFADSNFNTAMGQFYLDLGCFGTAGVDMGERDAEYGAEAALDKFLGFQLRTLPLGSIAVGQNAAGIIDQIFVKFDFTAEQWVQRFGRDKVPSQIAAMMTEDPDRNFPVVVCRFKRTPQSKDGKPTEKPAGPLMPEEREWAEVWVDYEHKVMVDDNGTYERSAFIGRWRTRTGDMMGYGPGERALPTIKSLNKAEELEMKAWAKAIDPPIKTTLNNIVGDVDMDSGGQTVVRDMEKSQPWDLRPDLNHHMIEVEDKRFQIRDIFGYHALELPPREAVGEMTAFEVAKRTEQVYRSLGPVVVQLPPDVINGLIERGFGIMYRKGAFLQAPDIVLQAGGNGQLEIEYLGPLALAQKSTEIEAIDHFIGDALALKNSDVEEAMDLIDLDEAMRYKAKLRGVPAKVLRSKDQVKEIQESRAEAKKAAAEEQSAMNAAASAKDLAAGSASIGAAGNANQMENAVVRMAPRAVA